MSEVTLFTFTAPLHASCVQVTCEECTTVIRQSVPIEMQFALRIARVPELTLPDEEMLDPRRTTAYWAGLDGILDAMLAFERAPETCDFVILMTKEPEA